MSKATEALAAIQVALQHSDAAYKAAPRFENLRLTATLSALGPNDAERERGGLLIQGKPAHSCRECGCAYQGQRDIRLTFNEARILAHWILDTFGEESK